MTLREGVTRGAAFLLAGRALSAGTQLAVTALLAHGLAKTDFGRFAVLATLFAILNATIDFGGSVIAAREMSRDPGRSGGLLGTLIMERALFAGAGYALAVCVLVLAGESPGFAALASLGVFVTVLSPFEVVFQVRLAMGPPVAVHALERVAYVLGLAALAAWGGLTLGRAVLLLVTTTAAGAIAVAALGHRLAAPRSPDPSLRSFLAMQTPQGIASVCAAAYFYLDTFYLRFLRGPEDVATYNAAYRIFSFGVLVPSMLLQALFPVLSELAAKDRSRFADAYREALAKLLLFGLPLLAAAPALAGGVIDLLYPHVAYAGAKVPLVWLSGALACVCVGTLAASSLVALGAQRDWMRIAGLALLFNASANLVAIPLAGPSGAAATALATEGFVAVACVARIRALAGVTPLSRQLVPAVAAACGAGLGSLVALPAGFWAGVAGAGAGASVGALGFLRRRSR